MTASMTLRVLLPALILVVSGLSGCGMTPGLHGDTFKPYTPDVVQGNFVSREQRQQLRPGMTRIQVRDILGTPLVTSLFHADRWDYAFSIHRQGVPAQKLGLTLYFRDDVLDTIESDELPSESEFAQRLTGPKAATKAPALQATEEQLRQFPARQSAPAAAQPAAPLPNSYPPLESAPR